MIEIPVLDIQGKQIGSEQLDPALLGGRVRYELLKQAVVASRSNRRLGTVMTKSRGMVDGSTRKLYRQKGTGRARSGPIRTPVKVGGGHTFAKVNQDWRKKLPRQMRRLARNSAVLAKALSGSAFVLSGLEFKEPKTSQFAKILKATQADAGALLAVTKSEPNMIKSGRNIQSLMIRPVWELCAYEVLKARRLVFTPEAFKAFASDPVTAGRPEQA